ncbi:hypothetical protein DMP16_08565 [Sulfolobus sp. B1]|uniref:hypothetical protein n=1 Tax=Sulfolobus sp. B1 TaxID=2200888 RepID=UPI00117DDD6F|nr:hypothetical protein [Sulfolobus sp. B1]TRM95652.1 hypothetical protein DMP16_08565 [Sulfolobus sp. B1]
MRKISLILVIIVLLAFPSLISLGMASNQRDASIVKYQQYSSDLMIARNGVTYSYSSIVYNSTSTTNMETLTYTQYKYDVTIGSIQRYSGNLQINVTPFSINVYSQIPQLARVILIEPNFVRELVWAGFLNTSNEISGIAYFNNTATLVLEFLNGTTFTNVTFNISHTETQYTKSVSLSLLKVNLTLSGYSQYTLSFTNTFPRRYGNEVFTYNGMTSEAPYNTSIAYFNGTYVPAMIWRGEVKGLTAFSSFNLQIDAQFTNIEFFGVNGSVIGDLDNSYVSSYFSHNGFLFNLTINNVESHMKLVINPNAEYGKAKVSSMISVSNIPVVIEITDKGVESTAEVQLYHQVVVIEPAMLVSVNVNGYGEYVTVFPNVTAEYVRIASPSYVNVTNITLNSNHYTAQVVKVNSTISGYIVFNVSLLKNETFVVFKQTSNGMVQLNPNDYFIYNGKIIVFDDPSTTYYIVYGYKPSIQTPFTNVEILMIAVVVLVIIIALVLVINRRK